MGWLTVSESKSAIIMIGSMAEGRQAGRQAGAHAGVIAE